MRFNPVKRILYTDKGEVIKKLDCPYKVTLSEAMLDSPIADNVCDICNGEIVDTSSMNEEQLLTLSKHSNVCFKIDPAQRNVNIVYIQ